MRDVPEVVDIFCGAGGLSYGLKAAGLTVKAGIDLDPACRFPFVRNIKAPFHQQDVAKLPSSDVQCLFSKSATRVLAGCAPCQPFSGYTSNNAEKDDRWQLLLDFLRLARDIRPEIVTMENVPRLSHLSLWTRFVTELQELGYRVDWAVLDAADFGVPQARRRLVLLASRLGPIQIPQPTANKPKTVRDAIGKLPQINAGEASEADHLHATRVLTDINLQRIQRSTEAGTWRDWPDHLRTACHRKKSGKTYPSVYGRMSWDAPSPTITTQFYGFGNGRFGHPTQDRALSLREGAILQSFPESFAFVERGERINFRAVGRLIGNAVPPLLGKEIGKTILQHATLKSEGAAAGSSRSSSIRSQHR
ncbi:MAG: DNA cytosine methyltransferase [Hyphomicrobiaceae bacterium]